MVEELLIAACELVQLAGNGESDQEIGTGEQQMLLALQPLGSMGVSALGAVPVVERSRASAALFSRCVWVVLDKWVASEEATR